MALPGDSPSKCLPSYPYQPDAGAGVLVTHAAWVLSADLNLNFECRFGFERVGDKAGLLGFF